MNLASHDGSIMEHTNFSKSWKSLMVGTNPSINAKDFGRKNYKNCTAWKNLYRDGGMSILKNVEVM